MVGTYKSRSSGKERDTETGLDYFGARYYGSNMGRFLTPDWAARPTAVPYANFGDPQSLNLYSYVGNNPLRRFDPDGHYSCADGKDCSSANDKRFIAALDKLKAARDSFTNHNSKEFKRLDKIISGYGEMNKGGPVIAFGSTGGSYGGVFSARTNTITFSVDNIAKNGGTTVDGKNFVRDFAVQAGHEGQHYVDRGLSLAPSQQEYRAYEASAYAARGVGFDYYGWGAGDRGRIWDSWWKASDRQANFNTGFSQIWADHYQGEGPIVKPLDPYPNQ